MPDRTALTAKEQAQWILHRLVPDRGVCNIQLAFRVERAVRWWPLQEALNHLLRRHPALRAVVATDAAVPSKRFLPEDEDMPFQLVPATEESLDEQLTAIVERPFEMDGSPLARAYLLTLPSASVVCIVVHHMVADHFTLKVLLDELPSLYDSYAADDEPPPRLAGTAPVYLEPVEDRAAVEYWLHHLDGVDPARLVLAGARPLRGRPTFAGDRTEWRLSKAAFAALTLMQERLRATQNTVLLAAYYLLLARHGAGPDLVVGVPVNGRFGVAPEVAGFHANTLPVRVTLDDTVPVKELVGQVVRALLSGMEYAGASFEAIQSSLTVRSDDWRVPLFRHMFNYRGHATLEASPRAIDRSMAGAPLTHVDIHVPISRLDLEWILWPSSTNVGITATFSTEVHDREFVELLLRRYEGTIVEMARDVEAPVGEILAWSDADRALSREHNATEREWPARSLLEQIRDWSSREPEAVAIRCGGQDTTYRELVAAADTVRQDLAGRGIGGGDVVALHATRGPGLVAAVLGIWLAGATYLPLDPAQPAARLAGQLDDAGVRLVLADEPPPASCLAGREWMRLPGADGDRPASGEAAADWPAPDPDGIAYLIYTSGSTGKPKGVEVAHRGLANVVLDFVDRLSLGPGQRTLWLTTFSFDISALELLMPLVSGGTLVVAPDADRVVADRLLDLVATERVDVVQATPTTWRHVSGDLRGRLAGRTVLSGGEPLHAALAERLLADGCRLFNVYGPTETTIWSTAVELTSPVPESVPVGRPIANTSVHVLTPDGRPVPPGVPGELCIGGAGLARGYRDQVELTAERFPTSPRLGRYYRTGDRVRLTADGLEFLGRLDRQVKVRGHRIELTEVESAIERHPGVGAAAVIAEPDSAGHLRLVAAVQVEEGGGPPAAERLREHLAGLLPDAAVPSRYVFLDALPLTGNGKVDYPALATRVRAEHGPAVTPDDPVLRRLVELWREVLGVDQLGPDADFFLHGGHSLLAVALAARVGEEFAQDVGFELVFEASTPVQMHALLHTRVRAADGVAR
ncbi:non-ribosomal peptide synthetase [Phytohabitans houttuyneae]|uniref:non-ribosomal peptide synthetase n=1 Tax=Phytohabitans houttuyneae TaxID=1076126 RepID=UPI00156753F7|nr:non-ribosomal peptide synthetase [Phytohabitans houttuyneae]